MDKKIHIIKNPQNGASLKLFHSSRGPEKRTFRQHHHAEFEISLFKEGTGTYRVLDNSYDFKSGDIFMFSTDEVHCITDINSETTLMNIQFEPRFIWSFGGGLLNSGYLNLLFGRTPGGNNRLDRNNPATEEIRRLMLEIENEFLRKNKEYELMINIRLLNIFALLMRCYNFSSKETDFKVTEQSLICIDNAINYINENLTSDISLDDIAKNANLSRTYFSTLFKRLNGISPWDYITIKRVEKAMALLKKSDETVLQIATKCGFNNTANFNRAFKKVTGKVPGDYKR